MSALPQYFSHRAHKKPLWPTFRGGVLDEPAIIRITSGLSASGIYCSVNNHVERELPNGGIGRGGTPTEYPAISFDYRRHVLRPRDNRRTALYIIGWIGGYGKGSILHFGWQFPHVLSHDEEDVKQLSYLFYCNMARWAYGEKQMDREVQKMLDVYSDMPGLRLPT